MKKINLILLACSISTLAIGQTVKSAVDYATHDIIGSGRYVSMGGAFTALGGDLSSVKLNPAGAGLKRSDEWAVTGAFTMFKSTSSAGGNSFENSLNNFSMPDITYTKVNPTKDRYWKTVNFTVGLQRINNLNSIIETQGSGRFKSYLNSLKETAQEYKDISRPLEISSWAYQAFQTFLIDTNQKGLYYSMIEDDGQDFTYDYDSEGRMQEMFITISTAYKEKFFIGGTLGFPIVRQTTYSKLTESNFLYPRTDLILNGTQTQLTSAHFETRHDVTGSGVVGKFGVIYKVDKSFRIGGSYHTPTYYNLEDVFSYTTTAYFKDFNTQRIRYGGGAYFNLLLPAQYNLGMSYVFGKKGLISFDYNYTDISTTKYIVPVHDINYEYFNGNSTNGSRGVNDILAEELTGSHTIKLGGEYNMKPFRVRGGFSTQSSPYKNSENLKSFTYSGGLGYSRKEFYVDLGYAYRTTEETIRLDAYEGPEGVADETYDQHQVVLTVGVKVR